MGRAARAGVRVGFFACLCLCRERPPCEGLIPCCIPPVTAEGPEAKIWGFPSVPRAPCGVGVGDGLNLLHSRRHLTAWTSLKAL